MDFAWLGLQGIEGIAPSLAEGGTFLWPAVLFWKVFWGEIPQDPSEWRFGAGVEGL